MTDAATPDTPDRIEAFIARWTKAGGSERANYQIFLTELTELLGLPKADPASDEAAVPSAPVERQLWPKELTAQVKAVADLSRTSWMPSSEEDIAAGFEGKIPCKFRLLSKGFG